MIKLSAYIMRFLADRGFRHAFVLPGGGAMHLIDSLGREKRIKPITYLHEQAAVIAADAYAQYLAKPALAIVTTGPGATNAITAVAASWIDSTPLLILSGQVKRSDLKGLTGLRQRGVQEIDIISMAKGITKYACSVLNPNDIRFHLEYALWLAEHGRKGPVWLDIPLDVQAAMIDEEALCGYKAKKPCHLKSALYYAKTAASMLKASLRPIILVGNGTRLSGALSEFLELSNFLKVPVLTTWRAIDFFDEDAPFYFGRPGSIASRDANFIQQNADFLLSIGARLDLPQVGHNYEGFAKKAKKVIVDIDKAELEKLPNNLMWVKALCDAKAFILAFKKEAALHECKPWLNYCRRVKARFRNKLGCLAENGIDTYAFISALSKLAKPSDILVPGSSGACAEITMQAFRVKRGQRIFNSPGLGSMGFGLPAASGAAIASGQRVISIIGDGGLEHNIQALETIRRLKLCIKIFVLDNKGYGSIRLMQKRHFSGNYVCCDSSSGLTLPSCTELAKAFGIPAFRISAKSDLQKGLEHALSLDGPVLCALDIAPFLETAPKAVSIVNSSGIINSSPLENLWPFLSKPELKEAMRVD